MGRLDNAMRRASEEKAKASAATLEHEVTTEDFPSEEASSSRESDDVALSAVPDSIAPVAPAPPVVPDVPDLPIVPTGPAGPAGPIGPAASTHSLFEHIDARLATKTVVDDTMMPASREQYRRLAAALHQMQRANGFKVAMVVSAVASEGKTLTAANLALTLSESYRRNVLLIDGDLRRPSLHTVFQVAGAPGLSDGLISIDEPKLPLHRLSARLAVLPAGRPTSDPIGALTSDRMRRLVDEAREVFDWVIIDTPPIGLLTDATLLSAMADGVVMVIKAEATSVDMVNRAVEAIGRDRLLGVVLNRATEHPHRTNYDYYKYYGSGTNLPAVRE
jgi:protein-tyrosine kinase